LLSANRIAAPAWRDGRDDEVRSGAARSLSRVSAQGVFWGGARPEIGRAGADANFRRVAWPHGAAAAIGARRAEGLRDFPGERQHSRHRGCDFSGAAARQAANAAQWQHGDARSGDVAVWIAFL